MKLGISTYTLFSRFCDEKSFKLIKAAGFDAVDYGFFGAADKLDNDNYIEWAKGLKNLLDEIGLECNQAHAPYDFKYGEKTDMTCLHYAEVSRSIEAAAVLGAKNIVIHSVSVPENVDMVEYNINYYRSFLPICEKANIHISVENLFESYRKDDRFVGRLATPRQLTDFIEKLNSPWFNACVDVGHASITGIEPQDFIRGMDGRLLQTMHLHDNDYYDDSHLIPLYGKMNWNEICSALAEVEFKGDFNMELGEMFKLDNDIMPSTLAHAAAIGRNLIKKIEKKD